MKLLDFYGVLNEVAPKTLSDEFCARYGAYDNSGILIDTGCPVDKALFSLEFSAAAVAKAIETGANVIVTHHPAIYGKISEIRDDAFSPLGKKLLACIRNGISVISMHLNLDGAVGGIDESLMRAVQISAAKASGLPQPSDEQAVSEPLQGGGYGRAYTVAQTQLSALCKALKAELGTERLWAYANNGAPVQRAASFCGAGGDEKALAFACEQGASVVISSDFRHHVLAMAADLGVSVIALTHYASENYGFEKYYEKIGRKVDIPCEYHVDENLL